MPSTLSLSDGTKYIAEPIGYDHDVQPGDRLVFIAKSHPDNYPNIHGRVITVSGLSNTGGIAVDEYGNGSHFVRRCFHEIVWEREVDTSDFDAVFA